MQEVIRICGSRQVSWIGHLHQGRPGQRFSWRELDSRLQSCARLFSYRRSKPPDALDRACIMRGSTADGDKQHRWQSFT